MAINKSTGRTVDAAKREAIVAAARHSFLTQGFAAASIEGIAAEAGVSKVTVYNHFGDKRGLFVAAVEHECERISGRFSLKQLPTGDLRQKLLVLGEAIVTFLSRPEMVQFERRIAAETEAEPEIGAAFLAAGPNRMKQALKDLFVELDRAGDMAIDDPLLAAEQFAALCKGMGDLERRFGQPSDLERDRQRLEGGVEVFCRAYGRES
jgi:TetR/AcrR family transcriptional repressor of mexJK operon